MIIYIQNCTVSTLFHDVMCFFGVVRGDGHGWGEDNTDLNLEKPRDHNAEWSKPLNKRFEMIKDIISRSHEL